MPKRRHAGHHALAGARLGHMRKAHHGQRGSCLLASVYQMPSESPWAGSTCGETYSWGRETLDVWVSGVTDLRDVILLRATHWE